MKPSRKKAPIFATGLLALAFLVAACSTQELPPDAGVLMAFDFGNSTAKAQAEFEKTGNDVLNAVTTHAVVGVVPITQSAGTNPVVRQVLPNLSTAYLLRYGKSKADLKEQADTARAVLSAAIGTMHGARVSDTWGTNILAVLFQAHDELQAFPPGHRFLILFSDMVNQSPELEMTSLRPIGSGPWRL